MRKLPMTDVNLPIIRYQGRDLTAKTLDDLAILSKGEFPTDLLINRVKLRHNLQRAIMRAEIEEGLTKEDRQKKEEEIERELSIYTLSNEYPELTPEQQVSHMMLRDEIGLQLLTAELMLIREEISILGGQSE